MRQISLMPIKEQAVPIVNMTKTRATVVNKLVNIDRGKSNMPDPSEMSQEELDIWSDINNPNNDSDMDDWADAHNPNNDDYLGDDE